MSKLDEIKQFKVACEILGLRVTKEDARYFAKELISDGMPPQPSGQFAVYVVRCDNDVYYVGRSSAEGVERRISEHKAGRGAEYTKRHPVVEVVETRYSDNAFMENLVFHEYCSKYGIQSVRGSTHCNEIINKTQEKAIQRVLDGALDKCYSCGRSLMLR